MNTATTTKIVIKVADIEKVVAVVEKEKEEEAATKKKETKSDK